MSIFEETITFNTESTLEDFIELSAKRRDAALTYNRVIAPEIYTTTFGFGRRAGHTSAIVNYVNRNSNFLVVVHSESRRTSLVPEGLDRNCTVSISTLIDNLYCVGFRFEYENLNIIIDSCPQSDVRKLLGAFASTTVRSLPKSIVNVNPA